MGADTEHSDGASNAAAARLFVALWPDLALRHALHAWCRAALPTARAGVVAPQRLHLTLHFLGAVPRVQVAKLEEVLQVGIVPFELEFSRCEHWPHGLLVALPDAVPSPLLELHAALGRALQTIGMRPEERAYRPHVTLARRWSGKLAQNSPPPIRTVRWAVSSYALVESCSTRGTSRYQMLRRYP